MRRHGGIFIIFLACIGMLAWASEAPAAVTNVICVPWEGNVLADHQTWDGKAILLKAVVKADSTSVLNYTWDFGDGTATVTGTLSGTTKYNVNVFHAYSATPGTPFIATLTVSDGGSSITDSYRVRIKELNLDTERAVAVDDALWWLYRQQATDGHWASYSSYYTSPTASAVHAFEVNNHLPTGNPDEDPYVTAVQSGLTYLISRLQAMNIGLQNGENPDANGNGIGIEVVEGNEPYQGGMVMDAFINSRTPDASSGRIFVGTQPHTYRQIVQDMADMYGWGQVDATYGSYVGGWRYGWNYSSSDNSACQWAAIGMIPAERTWGCTIPQWVKDRNELWLNYSHYQWNWNGTANIWGGFGYTGPSYGDALTPSGMVQLDFGGKTTTDPRWVRCERWFADNWAGWINSYNYYAYYAAFKAFTLALPTPVETFSSNGFNWYRGNAATYGLAKRLIEDQNRSTTDSANRGVFRDYYGRVFGTAWATIILSGFEAQPIAVVTANPNPTTQDVNVTFDHSGSYHMDTTHHLVVFEYDWDNDGVYDLSTSDINAKPVHAFHCPTYPTPCSFPVTMRVTDDSVPVKRNTTVVNIQVTPPPHPPTSVPGGPYHACPARAHRLDGSGSFDIDEPQGDYIASYGWELDGLTPYDYDDATVVAPLWTWINPGTYNIALRVTDSYGIPNTAWTQVLVDNEYCACVNNLTAYSKTGKVQLVWTHVNASRYDIYRSADGGATFAKIAETTSTYSTYLDLSVTSGRTYSYYVKSLFWWGECDSSPVTVTVPLVRR